MRSLRDRRWPRGYKFPGGPDLRWWPVHIASAGAAPEDGFTGYRFFGGDGAARWGDYSGGAVDESGSIWMATEYIPNKPRTILANWGTFIANVAP